MKDLKTELGVRQISEPRHSCSSTNVEKNYQMSHMPGVISLSYACDKHVCADLPDIYVPQSLVETPQWDQTVKTLIWK